MTSRKHRVRHCPSLTSPLMAARAAVGRTFRARACPPLPALSICSFNVLAPCYKKADRAGWLNFRSESDGDDWRPRHQSIVADLARLQAHIICLQEYWFQPAAVDLYAAGLGDTHTAYTAQRPGQKQDGLAIWISKQLRVLDSAALDFRDRAARIAQMVHVAYPPSFQPAPSSFLVANTHLAFPHHCLDVKLRVQEAAKLVDWVDAYIAQHSLQGIPTFLAGDFNGHDDATCRLLQSRGFRSSFHQVSQCVGLVLPRSVGCLQHPPHT